MSRRPEYPTLPTGEQSLQDEETVSATGEGDEEMEDAEEQEEGYSACCYCPLISYFALIEVVMIMYPPTKSLLDREYDACTNQALPHRPLP